MNSHPIEPAASAVAPSNKTCRVRGLLLRLFPIATLILLGGSVTGCGGAGVKAFGKVTCGSKPVHGTVLFSPLSEGVGPPVSATLDPEGAYTVDLKAPGKYRIVVSPSDIVYPAKPGKEYPCGLAPVERDVKAGDNEIVIQLGTPGK